MDLTSVQVTFGVDAAELYENLPEDLKETFVNVLELVTEESYSAGNSDGYAEGEDSGYEHGYENGVEAGYESCQEDQADKTGAIG